MKANVHTRKILSVAIGAVMLSGTSLSYAEAPATAQQWFNAGKEAVQENKFQISNIRRAKNVILFVGDGMGISTVTASRILEGQLNNVDGEYNRLSFEKFPSDHRVDHQIR